MKIVVTINGLYRGGAERVISILTSEWALHHELVVVLFDAKNRAYELLGRVIDLRAASSGGRVARTVRVGARAIRLARVFRRERPDTIISFMESANVPSILAAMMTGMLDRLRVSVRNNPESIRLWWRIILPICYRLPERVVAPSEGVRCSLSRLGLPSRKLVVIHNPVISRDIQDDVRHDREVSRIVIGVGRLHRQKGFDRLIRSFAAVPIDGLRLVILGEGAERETLLSLAHRLGIAASVSFPGAVADIGLWYRRASCLVLSSRYEGWPNVLMEALSAGCPTVSFDCRYGPREILEHGRNGVLVCQHDIGALTAAITRVLSDPELRECFARRGLRRASEFAVHAVAPRWLAPRP